MELAPLHHSPHSISELPQCPKSPTPRLRSSASRVLPNLERGVHIILDLVHDRGLVVFALGFSLGGLRQLTAQRGLRLEFMDA